MIIFTCNFKVSMHCREAHKAAEAGGHRGKVVVKIS